MVTGLHGLEGEEKRDVTATDKAGQEMIPAGVKGRRKYVFPSASVLGKRGERNEENFSKIKGATKDNEVDQNKKKKGTEVDAEASSKGKEEDKEAVGTGAPGDLVGAKDGAHQEP